MFINEVKCELHKAGRDHKAVVQVKRGAASHRFTPLGLEISGADSRGHFSDLGSCIDEFGSLDLF